MIIWITGQPGSGKTSLGKQLAQHLCAIHIDGKVIWEMFNRPNDTFINRCQNVAEAQYMARLVNKDGRNVVVSMVSPYRCQREEFKQEMGSSILEVHTYADSDPNRPRQDHKFMGYEKPLENALFLDTAAKSIEECLAEVLKRVNRA